MPVEPLNTRAQDAYWWQGSLMTIKARAEDTGGALGVVEARFPKDFGPPLHVHRREDEALYVIDGEISCRQGDEELLAGPGTWVWCPRGVPHTFKVRSDVARAVVLVTPGGFERMFEVGGTPADPAAPPPQVAYDPEAAAALAQRFGFDVVGPQMV